MTCEGRCCLAASLAVWLLLFPPQAERSGIPLTGPDTSAPLREWQAMRGQTEAESGEFVTEHDCEEYRSKMILDAKERLLADAPANAGNLPASSSTVKWVFALGALASRCVSRDDPRITK